LKAQLKRYELILIVINHSKKLFSLLVFQSQVNADGVEAGRSDAGNARRFAQRALSFPDLPLMPLDGNPPYTHFYNF
jgi:hypothetical protein